MIGEVLGNRYKILREIGTGGMAWVYLAEDLTDKLPVAVKILYPHYNQDMAYVQRFIREAKLATQISNEHIVRILNYGSDRDVHYLVMEHIQGKDLSVVLKEHGKLSWQQSLEISAQVTLALDAANAQGVVHRDIKPQNIMLTQEGKIKVLDFGIARARAMPSLTQSGFVGSPYYISPEQAMGEAVDIRSDIYSLGIALYEMLCGKLPFDSSSPWSIISQHIANEPPNLSLQNIDVPSFVETLLRKMLAKDPADRYQTPGQLLAAIESALRGRVSSQQPVKPLPVQAEPPKLDQAHRVLLNSLYQRAIDAEHAQEWSRAVNLFNQIAKADPSYEDVSKRLARAGLQARLAALYLTAQSALNEERWQEAIDELSEIVTVEPDYKDAANLLTQAGISLAEKQTGERLMALYAQGLEYYANKDWAEAHLCFSQVYEIDPEYQNVARLHPLVRRRVRWAKSILGQVSRKISEWVNH
ncbi:MAG: protein kinase [Anaerolineae bacterium]|nr:protein kinase [Anaerolineae bacterium]